MPTSIEFNDEGTAYLSIFVRATTVGNVMAYLPLKVNLIAMGADSGINFGPNLISEIMPTILVGTTKSNKNSK
jgi:hypothetical protein